MRLAWITIAAATTMSVHAWSAQAAAPERLVSCFLRSWDRGAGGKVVFEGAELKFAVFLDAGIPETGQLSGRKTDLPMIEPSRVVVLDPAGLLPFDAGQVGYERAHSPDFALSVFGAEEVRLFRIFPLTDQERAAHPEESRQTASLIILDKKSMAAHKFGGLCSIEDGVAVRGKFEALK